MMQKYSAPFPPFQNGNIPRMPPGMSNPPTKYPSRDQKSHYYPPPLKSANPPRKNMNPFVNSLQSKKSTIPRPPPPLPKQSSLSNSRNPNAQMTQLQKLASLGKSK